MSIWGASIVGSGFTPDSTSPDPQVTFTSRFKNETNVEIFALEGKLVLKKRCNSTNLAWYSGEARMEQGRECEWKEW